MITRHFLRTALIVIASILAGVSCSEVPVRPELSKEQQREIDDSIGQRLAQTLEHRFVLHRDKETEVYLRGLAVRLMQGSEELKQRPAGVLIFREPPAFRSGEERLFFLGLPGLRVYVSLEYLRIVEFENELAAAIALQLANVQLRHLARNLQSDDVPGPSNKADRVLDQVFPAVEQESPPGSSRLGDRHVFRFSRDEMTESISLAVDLLYRAGYDPRGLSELWKRYAAMPGRTVYSPEEIEVFIRQTYRTIARYTPLRNPVVRSGAFLAFKKRIAGS